MSIPSYKGEIPYLTTEQMIEVDRAMIEDYRIELIQMMENAGRTLAMTAKLRFLENDARAKHVVVLVGTGGNGGGALVCARRLHNWGANVTVFVTKSDDAFTAIPKHQLDIVRRMGLKVHLGHIGLNEEKPDLIIDGVIGYSLKGNPRGVAGDLIRWANAQEAHVLSLDVPSGIDTTAGTVFEPSIRATATLTLALPKAGLRTSGVEDHVGELYLADISVPPELYAAPALGLSVGPIFAESDIVRLS